MAGPARLLFGCLAFAPLALGCSTATPAARSAGYSARPLDSVHHASTPRPTRDATSRLAKQDQGAPAGRPLPSSLSGRACLDELDATGVHYRPLPELRGVETPVEIQGPIGPVTFWVNGNGPLRLDCRMALTLHQLGPLFSAHHVSRVRFSGAYVYRSTRSGRLSHHAHGLALDMHDLVLDGQTLSVKKDFLRATTCTEQAPALNRLACALREAHVFEELLTPDYNADHYDHLHIAVSRGPVLTQEREELLAQQKAQREALARSRAALAAAQKKQPAESPAPREATPSLAPPLAHAPAKVTVAAKPTPAVSTAAVPDPGDPPLPPPFEEPADEPAPHPSSVEGAANEAPDDAAPPPPPPLAD